MAPTDANTPLKRTSLYARHQGLGAKLVDFGGWEMPLWYTAGAIREHLAVITAAGLFDTSHMDVMVLSGKEAGDVLDYAFTRDLATAKPGRAIYGVFLDASGHTIDDAVVYPLGEERYGIVVNASMGATVAKHLKTLSDGGDVTIAFPAPGKLDIQGPLSARILGMVLEDPASAFAKLPFFAFKGDFDFSASGIRLKNGCPALLSRSGYTGELGFELFVPGDKVVEVWDMLLSAGKDGGILPCGLAARDSLRTGAVLPLSHHDIGNWPFLNNPWTFALPRCPDGSFSKDFHGAEALRGGYGRHTLAFIGFDPRRVDSAVAEVILGDKVIGDVTTIVSDMAMGRVDGKVVSVNSPGRPAGWTPKGLACGFILVDAALPPGTKVTLQDSRRAIEVEIAADLRPARGARTPLPV